MDNNWLDIITAPKDGRRILVCDGDGNIDIAAWVPSSGGYWHRDPICDDGTELYPAYWQPLPLKPKQQ